MTQEELGKLTRDIVQQQFSFTQTLTCTLNNGCDQKELKIFIIKESIKELEYLWKKTEQKKLLLLNSILSEKNY